MAGEQIQLLHGLPAELRLNIYELIFPAESVLVYASGRDDEKQIDTALLVALVNDPLYNEACDALYGTNTIVLSHRSRILDLVDPSAGILIPAGRFVKSLKLTTIQVKSSEHLGGVHRMLIICNSLPRLKSISIAWDAVQGTTLQQYLDEVFLVSNGRRHSYSLICKGVGEYHCHSTISHGLDICFYHDGLKRCWKDMQAPNGQTLSNVVAAFARTAYFLGSHFYAISSLAKGLTPSGWAKVFDLYVQSKRASSPPLGDDESQMLIAFECLLVQTNCEALYRKMEEGRKLTELADDQDDVEVLEEISDLLLLNGSASKFTGLLK